MNAWILMIAGSYKKRFMKIVAFALWPIKFHSRKTYIVFIKLFSSLIFTFCQMHSCPSLNLEDTQGNKTTLHKMERCEMHSCLTLIIASSLLCKTSILSLYFLCCIQRFKFAWEFKEALKTAQCDSANCKKHKQNCLQICCLSFYLYLDDSWELSGHKFFSFIECLPG